MPNNFIVVDFEMANNNLSSICQLGLVVVESGSITQEWSTLVNPHAEFGYFQQRIHGITQRDVRYYPSIFDLKPKIFQFLNNAIVCSYGLNDYHALAQNFNLPNCNWMNIHKIVGCVWPEIPKNQRGLKSICNLKGIQIRDHHDALSDSRAAATVMLQIISETGKSISDLQEYSIKKINL